MECDGFLGRPQQHVLKIKLVSWNVNGVRCKLENNRVQDFLLQYIICLNEVKTPLRVCLPGYVSYLSNNKVSPYRGGTVVMIKNYLAQSAMSVDTGFVDQVWFKLRCVPGVVFGAYYIPPSDSPYFSHDSFASIQGKVIENSGNNRYVIIDDCNAKFGDSVRELLVHTNLPDRDAYSYPSIPDQVNRPTENASVLAAMCTDLNLVVLNNLRAGDKEFASKLTYKQANVWVYELDVCMVSSNMIEYVDEFVVYQIAFLPSDHAPVSLKLSVPGIDLDDLSYRAGLLGEYILMTHQRQDSRVKKPIRWSNIDNEAFVNNVCNASLNVD